MSLVKKLGKSVSFSPASFRHNCGDILGQDYIQNTCWSSTVSAKKKKNERSNEHHGDQHKPNIQIR